MGGSAARVRGGAAAAARRAPQRDKLRRKTSAPPGSHLGIELEQQVAGGRPAAKGELDDAVHAKLLHRLQAARAAAAEGATASAGSANRTANEGSEGNAARSTRSAATQTWLPAPRRPLLGHHAPNVLAQLKGEVGRRVGLFRHGLRGGHEGGGHAGVCVRACMRGQAGWWWWWELLARPPWPGCHWYFPAA